MAQRLFVLLGLMLAGCSENPVVVFPPAGEAVYDSQPIPAYGATPTPQQRSWQDMEVNAFIHFGVNTFTGNEWGTGDESPSVFNPTALDARQWAAAAQAGGVRGLILTAKHHDGFALWPTPTSSHDVASSPWRGGEGDVVRELSEATRAFNLEFGIYLSPWDRHEPKWGTPAYNEFYMAQMYELTRPGTSNYGRLFEVWLDGAHGDEVTQEQLDTYESTRWIREIRDHQPGAVIAFSRDVQYSGNEDGLAPETYWNDQYGYWSPMECNTPFRGGWFWHADENPKSVSELVEIYFRTVGRDCVLLLGLAPDRRGLLEDEDVARLREWRATLDELFETDLARGREAVASSTREGGRGWEAGAAVDGDPDSFWASAERTGSVEVDLAAEQRVGVVEIREPIRYGQRVSAFSIEAEVGGAWREVASGTTVGRRRLFRLDAVRARRWRLTIEASRAEPAISTFALYREP